MAIAAVLPFASMARRTMSSASRTSRCARTGAASIGILNGLELRVLQRCRVPVDRLVRLAPARQRLHCRKPPLDVRVTGVIATNHVTERDERRREVIGDRERVAAEPAIRAEHRVIEDLHPAGGALAMPRERRRLHAGIVALEEREDLRIDEAVDELAAHLRVDPIHPLVDARAGAKRFWIR